METAEVSANLKHLEKKLEQEMNNAEVEGKGADIETSEFISHKLAVSSPKLLVRFICHHKNRIKAKIITKGMSEDDIVFVKDFLKTSPEEIELYKSIIDDAITELTPEEYKEWLNKWLCNPIILKIELVVEFELKSVLALRNALKIRSLDKDAK